MKSFLAIIVLAALVFSMISISEGCGKGWRRFRNKCYRLNYHPALKWIDALTFCRHLGGGLAVPRNEIEHQFLRRMAKQSGKAFIWIGLRDFKAEGKWLTFPDASYAKYVSWGRGKPNGGRRENCAVMARRYDYRWDDVPCSYVLNSICEKAK
uniref:C-type lectin domain-containing protein n=1 Tax=Pinctada fucata TaxID=50426 RepID=A0A194APV7_PINFU